MQNRQLHIIPDPQHPSIHHAPNSSSSGLGKGWGHCCGEGQDGKSEVQGANRLCAAPGVTCDHPHRQQEELVLFLYKRWVYFLVCQSCIQYSHGFWFFPKRISGSWWRRNFSFRYLPAHWIQSHGQIYTHTNTHTVPEIPLRDGLHGQNLYPEKIS